MRILGVDYGKRRTGLSVSDVLGLIAHGRGVIECGTPEQAVEEVAKFASAEKAEAIVVGLPVQLDDSVGRSAQDVLDFVELLKKAVTVPVETWDERMTSAQAGKMLRGAGLSHREKRVQTNVAAAQIILQSYLDAGRAKTRRNSNDD
jgi:putative Holliday junction resolvase